MINNPIKKIHIVLYCLVITIFYIFIADNIYNAIFAPDDFKVFFKQYREWVDSVSLKSTSNYLLGPTIHPHPKLTSRILSLISQATFGSINFAFIQFIGNSVLAIIFIYLLKSYKRGITSFALYLICCIFIFTPQPTTFWNISISSVPFLYLFALISFYSLRSQKWKQTVIFSFLSVFTSGQGFFIPLFIIAASFILRFFNELKSNKFYLLIFFNTLILVLYYYIIWHGQSSQIASDASHVSSIFNNVQTKILYFFSFLGNGLARSFGYVNNIQISFYLGILLAIIFIYTSVRTIFSKENRDLIPIVLFSGLFLAQSALYVIFRHANKVNETVPPRYEIQSIFFIITLLILIQGVRLHKVSLWALIFIFGSASIYRTTLNYKAASNVDTNKIHNYNRLIANDPTYSTNKIHTNFHDKAANALREGLHIPTNKIKAIHGQTLNYLSNSKNVYIEQLIDTDLIYYVRIGITLSDNPTGKLKILLLSKDNQIIEVESQKSILLQETRSALRQYNKTNPIQGISFAIHKIKNLGLKGQFSIIVMSGEKAYSLNQIVSL